MTATHDRPPARRRRWLYALILLLLLLTAVGGIRAARPGDPGRVRELRDELRAAPPDQRRAKAGELRAEVGRLSGAQRAELFTADLTASRDRMKGYFALPPAERARQLDRDIDRAEQARKARAAGGSGAPGGPKGAGQRPGGSGGPGGRPQRTPEEVEKRRKEMLQRTTPEQRALMDQVRAMREKYRDDLNRRRQQRGLPPATGFGGPR